MSKRVMILDLDDPNKTTSINILKGTVLEDMGIDPVSGCYRLKLSHPSFAEVPECMLIPHMQPGQHFMSVDLPGHYTLSPEQLLELRKYPEASLAIAKLGRPIDPFVELFKISGEMMHRKVLEAYAEPEGIPVTAHFETKIDHNVSICECGGYATGTTHSEWCPKK